MIAPSLLSADFLHLENDVRMIDGCSDLLHLDIMDGSFVPNISFGFPVVDAVAKVAQKPLDAHLMTVHPERWFSRLASAGVRMVSFHLEAAHGKASDNIKALHDLGVKAGVVINPDIPVKKLFKYVGEADYLVIMSVFAGFAGQKFIYESLDRTAALRDEIIRTGASTLIEVDGGVTLDNAKAIKEAGADILVAGSTVFKSADPAAMVAALRNI